MKNRSIITITNYKGSKSYSLHSMTKMAIWVLLAVLLVVFVVNVAGILWLKQEVVNLRLKKTALLSDYDVLNKKNQALFGQVKIKNAELGELKKIEEMIGIGSDGNNDDTDRISERINVAKHTFIKKNFVLNHIPSGYPINKSRKPRITSSYGFRSKPVQYESSGGSSRSMHWGIDFQANIGTPIQATAKGIVVFVGLNSGFGKLVKIRHSFGFETYFAHLNKFAVKKGDYVNKGDIIAYSGNSGRSTGPHLHYEIRHLRRPLNPYNFLKWSLSSYDIVFEKEKAIKWNKLLSTITMYQTSTPQPQQ